MAIVSVCVYMLTLVIYNLRGFIFISMKHVTFVTFCNNGNCVNTYLQ